jgi:SAM-dependent methyltransferase
MSGLVVDVGGKKKNPRGSFRPPSFAMTRWFSVNIDVESAPDLIADAHRLPLKPGSADCILCCEVLEHLKHPELCVQEMLRILKPRGTLILSIPFLYPIHADPQDFGRFTPQWVIAACGSQNGLQITPMGGWLGTVGMFVELGSRCIEEFPGARFLRKGLQWLGRGLSQLEILGVASASQYQAFTTGYFCVLHKPDREAPETQP